MTGSSFREVCGAPRNAPFIACKKNSREAAAENSPDRQVGVGLIYQHLRSEGPTP